MIDFREIKLREIRFIVTKTSVELEHILKAAPKRNIAVK